MATKSNDTGRSGSAGETGDTNEKSPRGTAAGMRMGASTRTEAKKVTSTKSKASRKEQTKRGGPGTAGTSDGARAGQRATPQRNKATRRRGEKARAGA
ncbi:MAG: hypothetical protein EOO73_35610 [Myxococcales bacterium]|nr:MAG: hypothetical protein EOO73_35610 [Myxococcales bacterium]